MKYINAGFALMMMAAGAQAASITFNTNGAGTGFAGSGLSLSNSSGAMATLVFTPNGNGDTAVPSNLNYGRFTLRCAGCSTQDGGVGAFFDPFIFNLVLTDVTTGGVGKFTGLSNGGVVYTNGSTINISWAMKELGSGSTNADSGTFGSSRFSINPLNPIVNPSIGQGQTTVQGAVIGDLDFPLTNTPEPATFGLLGAALLGLGCVRRRQQR